MDESSRGEAKGVATHGVFGQPPNTGIPIPAKKAAPEFKLVDFDGNTLESFKKFAAWIALTAKEKQAGNDLIGVQSLINGLGAFITYCERETDGLKTNAAAFCYQYGNDINTILNRLKRHLAALKKFPNHEDMFFNGQRKEDLDSLLFTAFDSTKPENWAMAELLRQQAQNDHDVAIFLKNDKYKNRGYAALSKDVTRLRKHIDETRQGDMSALIICGWVGSAFAATTVIVSHDEGQWHFSKSSAILLAITTALILCAAAIIYRTKKETNAWKNDPEVTLIAMMDDFEKYGPRIVTPTNTNSSDT